MGNIDENAVLPQGTYYKMTAPLYAALVTAGAKNLRANAEEVNDLNVFPVPDGDTGDNMSMTVEGGAREAVDIHGNLAVVSDKISRGMLLSARGNSGVITSQFFAGFSKGFEGMDEADASQVVDALESGVKTAYSAVMNPTEGTILTVFREGVQAVREAFSEKQSLNEIFDILESAMNVSLQNTPELLDVLKEAGVIDSGGAGALYIIKGFNACLRGDSVESTSVLSAPAHTLDFSVFGPDSEMTYGYCTELLVQLQNSKCDPETFEAETVKDYLETIGNSIVAFKTGTIIKLHVHTLTPYKVLEFCQKYGEFLTVKIENMSIQHNNVLKNESAAANSGKSVKGAYMNSRKKHEHKKYGYVSVSTGDGFKSLFTDLGVDFVVDGGQTNNPSAEDFLDAYKTIDADNIFVFPNNGNIILAAQQAGQMYDRAKVYVVQSKDIGQGYVAMSCNDPTVEDPEDLFRLFNDAMGTVSCGTVSVSVRGTTLNGISIKKGEYIGFVGKTMLVCEKTAEDAALKLTEKMLEEGGELVTVFVGREADAKRSEMLIDTMTSKFDDVEIYPYEGGQNVYPYLIVVEE